MIISWILCCVSSYWRGFPQKCSSVSFLENHLLHVILSLPCVIAWLFGAINKLYLSNIDNPYIRSFNLVSFAIYFFVGEMILYILELYQQIQIQILLVLGQLVLSYVVEMCDHLYFGLYFHLPYFLPRNYFLWLPLSSLPLVDQFDLFGHVCCFNWFS